MQFLKLVFRPGQFTDGTSYANEGSWFNVDKVRFRKEFAEKFGGWTKFITDSFVGRCRNLHNWATNQSVKHLGIGTTSKIYVVQGADADPAGAYPITDITPIRRADQTVSVQVTAFSSLIVVTDTLHGANQGDYVTLSGSLIPEIDAEHKISALGDTNGLDEANKYTIQIDSYRPTSTSSVSAIANYQTNVGSDVSTPAQGWGQENWGEGPWGGTEAAEGASGARVWNMDNYGDDLLINLRFDKIYYWDESTGGRAVALNDVVRSEGNSGIANATASSQVTIYDENHGVGVGDDVTITSATTLALLGTWSVVQVNTRSEYVIQISSTVTVTDEAVTLKYYAGTAYCPTRALQVLTSEKGRHVIAFGANDIGSTQIDKLLVRWSTSGNALVWEPLSTNSAGFQNLSSGSEIIGALGTRLETLIWTDNALTSMRYVGSPFYFSFNDVGRGMSMVGPNAAANANGVVYFMDRGSFYVYSGSVQRLRCPVLSTVFDDFNYDESIKVACGTNLDFSEVIWFYPSATSTVNDRYVIYNYDQQVWYCGSMVRGAWDNAAVRPYPKASSINVVSLGADPISTPLTSTDVVVVYSPNHGLSIGDTVIFNGVYEADPADYNGLNSLILNTAHTVTAAEYGSDTDYFVISVGTYATSTGSFGGNNVTYDAPNYIYSHEYGWDDDGSPMTASIETGDFDLGDGDRYLFLSRMIPDIKFIGGNAATGEVKITMNGRDFPLSAQDSPPLSESTFTSASTQAHIRGRARQASMKVESTGSDYGWRLGLVRLDVRSDGKR